MVGVDQVVMGGRAPWTLHHQHADHETLLDKNQAQPIDCGGRIQALKNDLVAARRIEPARLEHIGIALREVWIRRSTYIHGLVAIMEIGSRRRSGTTCSTGPKCRT